jgi:hypothetical protein
LWAKSSANSPTAAATRSRRLSEVNCEAPVPQVLKLSIEKASMSELKLRAPKTIQEDDFS